MAAHDAIFDKIMEMVGDDGPFQKRFNYIFNVGMVISAAMVYMNMILVLNVPDHWCFVPGREQTNFSMEEWKNLTLPRLIIYSILLFTMIFMGPVACAAGHRQTLARLCLTQHHPEINTRILTASLPTHLCSTSKMVEGYLKILSVRPLFQDTG